ncbi:putative bifunctional diguanylate cyclase/phosphodiesterase [Salisediminibacterium selenitireducens]|uniref:Diguanylate cyclase/phosphodiesterase n=1 Tax=Bacillus selenitireducens (strain ATCC 700615 / DSM 15326 / MLS10) TaxID=439292 RepID=D6XT60_BACIE|nr:bifunctional diguanylate cyclase/phosphodiesterase [Salisediminibacterium selenitireducens]ADH98996.1 diguanylate cyclase/phosphodiesterase [[Bacillus] selenitireducens MLS10]
MIQVAKHVMKKMDIDQLTARNKEKDLYTIMANMIETAGKESGFVITDLNYDVLYISEWAKSLFCKEEERSLFRCIDIVHMSEKDEAIYNRIINNCTSGTFEAVLLTRQSQPLNIKVVCEEMRTDEGLPVCMMISLHDLYAQAVSVTQTPLLQPVDQMTGLKNRHQFEFDLTRSMRNDQESPLALLFFDLDRFKFYNATLGQFTGDRLLKDIAVKLKSLENNRISVYRYGGDQFAVVISDYGGMADINSMVDTVKGMFQQPFMIEHHELQMTASLGVSLFPETGGTLEELVNQAEMAMHASKEKGSAKYNIYNKEIHLYYNNQLTLEKRLHKAVENRGFQLHYQPQYDLAHDRVIGFEALIRWQDDHLGFVPPDRFIPTAEETGLIIPIGHIVLEEACRMGKSWLDHGLDLRVGVNISPVQFQHPDFIHSVRQTLAQTGLPAKQLDIEITENVLLYNRDECLNTLDQLKRLGVHISIDDFGTGFSSLSYLRTFPVDVLKIDQSFVRDVSNNHNDQAIVTSIIQLAHNMGMKVIAEGVETDDSLHFLIDRECDQMQGYIYSKPIPPEQISSFLAGNKTIEM